MDRRDEDVRAEIERRDAAYIAACEALSAAWTANAIERQRRRVAAASATSDKGGADV